MKGHLHLPHPHNQRLQRIQAPTYERLQARLAEDHSEPTEKPLSIHCGWGRLLIGQTYPDVEEAGSRPAPGGPRRTRHRALRGGAATGPGARPATTVPRPLGYPAPVVHRLPPGTPSATWLPHPPGAYRGRLGGDQPPVPGARHASGADRTPQPAPPGRADLLAGRGRRHWRRGRHGDGPEPRQGIPGSGGRLQPLVPGGGPAMQPAGGRRGAGAAPGRALHEPRTGLPRSLGAAQQPAGQGALPQARLPRAGDLHHQAQERHQPVAVPRSRPGGRPQPLRPDHRRRGPPPRYRGARRRRRGRPVHPDPGRPADPLPRIALRPDHGGEHDPLPGQGPHPSRPAPRRPAPAAAAPGRQRRGKRRVPRRARFAGGQAGGRRAGPGRGGRPAHRARGRGGHRGRPPFRLARAAGLPRRPRPARTGDRLRGGGRRHPPPRRGDRRRPAQHPRA